MYETKVIPEDPVRISMPTAGIFVAKEQKLVERFVSDDALKQMVSASMSNAASEFLHEMQKNLSYLQRTTLEPAEHGGERCSQTNWAVLALFVVPQMYIQFL